MRYRTFSSLAFLLSVLSTVGGRASAQTWTFTHLAGGDGGHDAVDGAGPAARLHSPRGVALDAYGNLYVADSLNHTVRRISPAGEVSTLAGFPGVAGSADGPAGAARFDTPFGVAVDGAGTVYVADSRNHTVRAVAPNGMVTTLAGRAGEPGSNDGRGCEARFRSPFAVAVDPEGKVWVADYDNSSIRTIAPDGRVTTLAGQACASGFEDGNGAGARFNHPTAIAFEPSGDALVADGGNYAIRRVTRDGVVTTLLGPSPTRSFCPGIATDALGNAYILDRGLLAVFRRTPAGEITTLAGSSTTWGSRDGRGSDARFHSPWALVADASGTLFVADTENHLVRKISLGGDVTTLAGLVGAYGYADGPVRDARFFAPRQLAVDRWGNAYVPDNGNHVIRKITADGLVTTLAGLAGVRGNADGPGSAARFDLPSGVAVDPSGNVLVADSGNQTIRKITPDGNVTTLAGRPGSYSSEDGVGAAARFYSPLGIACDDRGNAYVADTGNHTIRKITPDGRVTTLAGRPGAPGTVDGAGSAALFNTPYGIAVDRDGNVFVSDGFSAVIRRISPDGNVRTVAGLAFQWGHVDGAGGEARFYFPARIAVDGIGNLFIADSWNQAIRKLTPDGEVTTIGGPLGPSAPWVEQAYPVGPGRSDGLGSNALFNQPEGIAVGPNGTLFVADMLNHAIRLARPALPGDVATIDAQTGQVRVPRRLDAISSSATEWEWSVVRRPAGSSAGISSPSSKDPTFVPDAPSLYVLRLAAIGPGGATVSDVSFDARCQRQVVRLDGGYPGRVMRKGVPPP